MAKILTVDWSNKKDETTFATYASVPVELDPEGCVRFVDGIKKLKDAMMSLAGVMGVPYDEAVSCVQRAFSIGYSVKNCAAVMEFPDDFELEPQCFSNLDELKASIVSK